MSGDTTYHGWRNVETWRVQLHLANDETHRDIVSAAARRHIGGEPGAMVGPGRYVELPWWADGQPFGQWVREFVELHAVEETTEGTWGQFRGDVVSAALARVDWEQIAAHWIEAARHELGQGATA